MTKLMVNVADINPLVERLRAVEYEIDNLDVVIEQVLRDVRNLQAKIPDIVYDLNNLDTTGE